MADHPTEIGIARKARDAVAEAEQLRAENARLVEQLDAYRANRPGTAISVPPIEDRKCVRCECVFVDEKQRRVTCQRCGATLDAFDVLHQYAIKERRFFYANEKVKREHAQLKAEIEAMQDTLKAKVPRVNCPRGCGAMVVPSTHAGGVTPHACYARRAQRRIVPQTPADRWRVVQADGAVLTAWCSQVEAMRFASQAPGRRVEEYTKPIGDKAERAAERVAEFKAQEERRIRG